MRNDHLAQDGNDRKTQTNRFYGKSLRLPGHDYSQPCVYHIVTCAQGVGGRGPLFEHPVLRQLLQTNWLDLLSRFPSIYLEALEIMPDHVHFIIWMNKWPQRLQDQPAPYLWQVMQAFKSKVAVEWLDYIKQNHPGQPAKYGRKNTLTGCFVSETLNEYASLFARILTKTSWPAAGKTSMNIWVGKNHCNYLVFIV